MVIVLGNGIGDPSSNPGHFCFTWGKWPYKRHESIWSPSAMGK